MSAPTRASTVRCVADVEPTPRLPALVEAVRSLGSCVVAFSGGVDSALLLKVARDVLGGRALGAIAVSPSLAAAELAQARDLAAVMGVPIVEVATDEMSDPLYVANSPRRCHACKSHLFDALESLRAERGLARIAYGAIGDDLGDHRPGMDAARERGIAAPLLDAGLFKAEAREISRRLGLPTWDKPAMACLASRVPHGTPVTIERLGSVERAEEAVRSLGFLQVRVRHHGDLGRVEVGQDELDRALASAARIEEAVRESGFARAEVDPLGYGRKSRTPAPA